MSDEMLHDDELDAVAGGTNVLIKGKTPTGNTGREKTAAPPEKVYTIDRNAANAGLGRFRGPNKP